jgi:hypothetical protein
VGSKKSKLKSITLKYSGRAVAGTYAKPPTGGWKNLQADNKKHFSKVRKFVAGGVAAVKLTGKGKGFDLAPQMSDSKGKYLYVGKPITLHASEIGRKTLPPTIVIKVNRTTVTKFATSCKYDIQIGDIFGPWEVAGFQSTKAGDCGVASPPSDVIPEENSVLKVPTSAANANSQSSQDSDGDDDGRKAAAIALGVVGAAVAVLIAVGVALHYRKISLAEDTIPINARPGVFEVDLDSRKIRRLDEQGEVLDANVEFDGDGH